ncbi:MAG: carbamoyltransferase HypF [Alphaproteobacteria bacterium]|nr:carbamoyltransferase HypF [Alphaproteobacteria bacterium]
MKLRYAQTACAQAYADTLAVETVAIRVRGTVQGVGFRPTVWRLARAHGLKGDVRNDAEGVLIRAQAPRAHTDAFLLALSNSPPALARIESIEVRAEPKAEFDGFVILESGEGAVRTNVSADAATCAECLAEIADPNERRYRYPFTNCTHCGPRISIVMRVPYDRAGTTMAPFAMCADCAREYSDPADRRFHAQPIACPACGPKLWIDGKASEPGALDAAIAALRQGQIVALRGIGGFHLACDAANRDAVRRLRERKRRFGKPFALMARDIEVICRFAAVGEQEALLLTSPGAPIAILAATGAGKLPDEIAPGLKTLGFMLPYTPLHRILVEAFDTPLVMTSGNVSQEPQIIDNEEARAKLCGIADLLLLHDREIANRIDDSVVRVMAGRVRMIRRARGFAPAPLAMPPGFEDAPEILAFGGELKSTFCLVKDGRAILSQHQGDLEDAATFDDFQKNLKLYRELYDHRPAIFACDLHPEYLSTKLAKSQAQGRALEDVQHHHAHVASCLAENGVPLDAPPVLGIVLDGLGFGGDGAIWGGEFLRADYRGTERLAHFKPVAMIGGAQAIREPWRNTYAHLVAAFGREEFETRFGDLELARDLLNRPLDSVDRMLANGINVPAASSCGRLFDAVAAAVGLCRDTALFEGQAAIALEDSIAAEEPGYIFDPREPRELWEAVLSDLQARAPAGAIAARFHFGLADAIARIACEIAPGDCVVLSGGCFQNRVLLESCIARLERRGFRVLTHADVAANDGGLSLGQAAVAAARALKG